MIVFKALITAMLLASWVLMRAIAGPLSTVMSGESAVKQLDNNDVSYITSILGMKLGYNLQFIGTLFFATLIVLVWLPDILRLFKRRSTTLSLVALGFLYAGDARAYYSQQDYTEVYYLLPSHSAFLIPDVGANQSSQEQFESEGYLKKNKVGSKLIQIPHRKLEGSGWLVQMVVPSARLIIVDRTPFYSEWATDPKKGTSANNQGFSCESAESINVSFDILASADVEEENAAKFLYWFGVDPLGSVQVRDNTGKVTGTATDPNDPNIMFASVIFGKSLKEVMDQQVRGYVHAAICNEMGILPLMTIFGSKAKIIKAVEKQTQDFFSGKGLTINFIGFASPLNYDSNVQTSINSVFAATKQAEAVMAMQAAQPVQQKAAEINNIQAQGDTMRKWDGKVPAIQLPSVMWFPQAAWDWLTGWFTGKAPATGGR